MTPPGTTRCLFAALALAVAMPGLASGASPSPAAVACDVGLNVRDPDPHGLNVRATPDATGAVVAVLKPEGEWITVHVTGQQGGWARIDRAVAIDDDAENGERTVFRGDGWVSLRLLGISGLYVGGGTALHQQPKASAPIVFRLEGDDESPSRVLGCRGKYLQVRYGDHSGWTDRWCDNERTTCS